MEHQGDVSSIPQYSSGSILLNRAQSEQMDQYTLWQILGIWALVALPMALLAWVVAPAIIPYSPLHPGITYWLLMIAGMVWQFVVSLVIMYRELGTLRWSAIRQRTWLQTPRDPKTDQPNPRLFWWVLPALFYSALVGFVLGRLSGCAHGLAVSCAAACPVHEISINWLLLSSRANGGSWELPWSVVIFNYFLGEEFLFRGVLLPKMQGVFGKYDWVANSRSLRYLSPA